MVVKQQQVVFRSYFSYKTFNDCCLLDLEHPLLSNVDNTNEPVKKSSRGIRQPNLIKYIILLLVAIILLITIFTMIYIMLRKTPLKEVLTESRILKLFIIFKIGSFIEVFIVKKGDLFGHSSGGLELSDDAEMATLTYRDTITRVTASHSTDLTSS